MSKPPLHVQLGLPKPRRLATLPKPGSKERKRPVQWEEQYQKNVAQFLGWYLPANCVYFAVPNGGWRTKGIAARLKACGVKAGVGDFVILWCGVHHELELKWDGSQSVEQKAHAARVVASGGKYGVARKTIEDVQRCLDEWGFPKRGAVLG